MVDFNESLNMTEFNEKNVEKRLAIELEARQKLG